MRKTKEERQWELVFSQENNKINVYEFNKWEKSEWKYITLSWKEKQITLYETEKTQVIACFIPEKNQINSLQIKKRWKEKNKCYLKKDISIQIDDTQVLKDFLNFLLKNDLNSLSKGRIELWNKIEIDEETIKTISLMLKSNKWQSAIKKILEDEVTEEDIVCIWYRKKQLEIFENMLNKNENDEKKWQKFLEKNSRILWYWLDYRYQQILKRECDVWINNTSWANSPIVDFLTGCSNFTVLVEVKTPETPLFRNSSNRAWTWWLSKELMDAHSQILSQKANRQKKSQMTQYKDNWEPITQKTIDPKTILIIWNSKEFTWNDEISEIKKETFELFRRDLKNIDILTYDELYQRAEFIVYWNKKIKETKLQNENWLDDELPF